MALDHLPVGTKNYLSYFYVMICRHMMANLMANLMVYLMLKQELYEYAALACH